MATQTDNFNRANGGLGTNWTTFTSCDAPQINTNVVNPLNTSTDAAAFYATATYTFTNDHSSEVQIITLNNTGFFSIGVRMQSAAKSGYILQLGSLSGGICPLQLKILTAGTGAQVINTNIALSLNDYIKLSIIGNVLTIYKNSIALFNYTDVKNSYTSGQPGFWVWNSSSVALTQVGNWTGSDITNGGATSWWKA